MQGAAEIQSMLSLIRKGERQGFNLLYAGYAAPLYGIIYRLTGDRATAENLLEATFVCICTSINEYNAESSFFTWVIQIAQHISRAYMGTSGRPECKDAMELIFLAGYSYDETAEQLNVSKERVKADVRKTLNSYR